MTWPRRPSKYGHVRIDGMGSKLEAAVYQLLVLRERAGELREIRKQVPVALTCGISWRVDFAFELVTTGEVVYAEAKGLETDRYRLCLKLWRGGHGPGRLEVWKGSYRRPTLVDIIIPRKT